MLNLGEKIFGEVRWGLLNYLTLPFLGISFCFLEAFGRIKYIHFERFPIWGEKIIVVSNHPSLLDPFTITLLGFPWMNFPWLFSGLWGKFRFSTIWFKEMRKEFQLSKKLIPVNVPDKTNFYDPFYMRIFQGISVPVDRNGSGQRRLVTFWSLKRILNNGGRVLIFPEGTRTFKSMQKSSVRSKNGAELGKLKEGAALLALNSNAKILPIWVHGADKFYPNKLHSIFALPRLWHKITIKIGNSFQVYGSTRKDVTSEIAQALLNLADEDN